MLLFLAAVILAFEYLRSRPDKMLLCYFACTVQLGIVTIGKQKASLRNSCETFLIVSLLVQALVTKRVGRETYAADV